MLPGHIHENCITSRCPLSVCPICIWFVVTIYVLALSKQQYSMYICGMYRVHFVLLDVIEEHKHSVVSWINTTTACHPFVLFYAWSLLRSTWNNKRELGRVLSFGFEAEHSIIRLKSPFKYYNLAYVQPYFSLRLSGDIRSHTTWWAFIS